MALRDLLAGEQEDARAATGAAVAGRSITGFRPLQTQRDAVFGEPVAGAQPEPAPEPAAAGPAAAFAPSRQILADGRERVPFGGTEQRLAYPARDGFRNYWFNDIPGSIRRAERAGYAHVLDPQTGEPVRVITDTTTAGGRYSYLMEIPIGWYQEDKALQAAELDRRLTDIRKGQAGPGASDNRYIPQQGIKIVERVSTRR